MATAYYSSQLTAAEIEAVLTAIHNIIVPSNNGKIIGVNNGTLTIRSVTDFINYGSKTIITNGVYNPENDGLAAYSSVTVAIPVYDGTVTTN